MAHGALLNNTPNAKGNDLFYTAITIGERHGGLMVSVLESGSSGACSGPGWGHCVVFLGKTLYSQGASLHPGV